MKKYVELRLTLFKKDGIIDDEDRVIVSQTFDDIKADEIAQGIETKSLRPRIPVADMGQDRLRPREHKKGIE